jgi:hypothetical protein
MAKVYNISEYSNTLTNITLVDGLTPDKIKRRYIWLLNATVENAIVGEDDNGLVWYSGNWLSGDWEGGTWYSGIWYNGDWKDGKWYSYRYDTRQLLQRIKRILEKDNPIYSQFRNGIWRRGSFYNGYFGAEDFFNWSASTFVEIIYHQPRWESGIFYNGIFRNAAWLSGMFQNGIIYNGIWIDGTFSNGTFQGYKWWNGNFTGGDFVLGYWMNGKFNQVNPNVKSRFGSMPLTGTTNTGTTVFWYDGQFLNGEFHSGLNIISGKTLISDNHNRTWWYGGTWYNGTWYGGTHCDGNFNNGHWYEGFWSGGTFNNGYWKNGFWWDGTVNGGDFSYGLFRQVTYNKGKLGYEPTHSITTQMALTQSKSTTVPKALD